MAFPSSPGVFVTETPLDTVVVGAATAVGALAGVFRWGPVGERVLLVSEDDQKFRFGPPSTFNYETWFTSANFLAYSNAEQVVRAANTTGTSPIVTANVQTGNTVVNVGNTSTLSNGMIVVAVSNSAVLRVGAHVNVVNGSHVTLGTSSDALATANGISLQFVPNTTVFNSIVNTAAVADLTSQIVATEDAFNHQFADGDFDTNVPFIAKWPGKLGDSLKVSVAATANAFDQVLDLSNSGAFTGNVAFTVDANTALVSIGANSDSGSFSVNTFNTFATSIYQSLTVGDNIVTGNDVVGTQTVKITGLGTFGTVGLSTNSATNTAITASSPNLTTTANAFASLVVGQFIALWANASHYETFQVDTVTSGNAVVLSTAPSFTVANGVWTTVNATSVSLTLNLEDKYKRLENVTNSTLHRFWEYADAFDSAPGQTSYVLANGNTAAQDEIHVVVVDEDGKFTGVPETMLEKWTNLSRATDAVDDEGQASFYKTVINNKSNYIWAVNDLSGMSTTDALNIASATSYVPFTSSFNYGMDGSDETSVSLGVLANAYDKFADKDAVDIGLIMQGKARGGAAGTQLGNYIIDNIAEFRQDAVAFISPEKSTVVDNAGSEANDIVEFRNSLRVSSYGFLDSGYKYQYDRYNDVYRYVPLNGDIAGLAARTEATNDAWWSPAGFNRGQIKNIVRLAWNPRQAERDLLYKSSVNPVVTFPGDGTILYGDKTLLAKPSAFDRINVRRLFIILEKSISKSARFTLFEFNDSFTRAQFRNLVIPFLRDIQGRRGIFDFSVVCDDTNNTPTVIDANDFRADIYVKPARSINFIHLNFYSVPTGVAFSEEIQKN